MSLYEGKTLFFVPGMRHLDQDPRASEDYPVISNDDRGVLYFANLQTPYYLSRAANEKALVVGCSGLNSHFLLSKEEIEHLNSRGLSVIWMALPLIGNNQDFMPKFEQLAEQFFTNPRSPAAMLFSPSLPRYALTHSTGAQLFLSLLHKVDANRRLTNVFSGAMHMAPFFDTAYSSRQFPGWMQRAFAHHCETHKDMRAGDSAIGKAYLKFMAWKEHYATQDNDSGPTFGQVMEAQKAGRRLQDIFNPAALHTFPNIFVLGEQDKFSCVKTSKTFADKAGIEVIVSKTTGHDPMKGREDLRDYFIGKVDICVDKVKARSAIQSVPVTRFNMVVEDIPYDLSDYLSDGARLALQSGTRLLNAGASFTQGLFAGGVRNPEVR